MSDRSSDCSSDRSRRRGQLQSVWELAPVPLLPFPRRALDTGPAEGLDGPAPRVEKLRRLRSPFAAAVAAAAAAAAAAAPRIGTLAPEGVAGTGVRGVKGLVQRRALQGEAVPHAEASQLFCEGGIEEQLPLRPGDRHVKEVGLPECVGQAGVWEEGVWARL